MGSVEQRVFISHASDDREIAGAVCAALETAGIGCWIAPRDIPPGVLWASSINEAIRTSQIIVLIYTERAKASSHVLREMERAAAYDVRVLPFRVTTVEPSGTLAYYIGASQWLDVGGKPWEEQLGHLAETTRHWLSDGSAPKDASPRRSAKRATMATAQIPEMVEIRRVPALLYQGRRFWIQSTRASIGRSRDPRLANEIVLDEGFDTISRQHATILTNPDRTRFSVRDEGSSNGTYLNDRELIPREIYELVPGPGFRLGNHDFVFEVCERSSSAILCRECNFLELDGAPFCIRCARPLKRVNAGTGSSTRSPSQGEKAAKHRTPPTRSP